MRDLVPLISIAKLPRGTEPGASAYGRTGNARFLRVSDLTGSRETPVYVKASPDLVISNTNDTLLALDGTPGVVARGISGAISSGIRRVDVIDSTRFAPDFIYYALQSAPVQEIIRKHSKGVTIMHASAALKEIKIPMLPLSEQLEMVKRLRVIEQAKQNQRKLGRRWLASIRESLTRPSTTP
jgi:restriction endonuclease S subunit